MGNGVCIHFIQLGLKKGGLINFLSGLGVISMPSIFKGQVLMRKMLFRNE